MNIRFIAIASSVLITATWGAAALADETAPNEPTKVTSESSSSGKTSGKQAQDSSSSTKNTKADEARIEARKRARVESRSRRGYYRNGYYYAPGEAITDGAGPGMSFAGSGGVGTHNAGIVFSPANGDRQAAMGIQWMSPKGIGLMFWGSGDLNGPDDLIGATIPHSDFTLRSTSGSFAVEALFALSQKNPTITIGAGLCTTKTWNYAVSNATGWKWDEGTETKQQFAGQIGCRFRVSDRMSVQYAYDTIQHNFFGLTMDF